MNRETDYDRIPGGAKRYWDNGQCTGSPYCQPRCPRYIDKEGTPVTIRPYQDHDHEQLVEMYVNLDPVHRTMGIPPTRREQIEEWVSGLATKDVNLVALAHNRIIGHTVVASTDDPEFVVFVHQAYHDRGVGTELTKQAIAYAATKGFDTIYLTVEAANRRAIHVYKKLGFEFTDDRRPELEMELELGKQIAKTVQQVPAEQ